MKRLIAASAWAAFAAASGLALEGPVKADPPSDATWTVGVTDAGDDFGTDSVWDGFSIVITVGGAEVVNESGSGDVDYPVDVSYGDTIAASLSSVSDDYDLALYGHKGQLRDESALEVSLEPDVVTCDVAMIWTVSVVDVGDDFGTDSVWDGFSIVITVGGAEVMNESESGDVDYLVDVSYGDTIDAALSSVSDDYDLALYDHRDRLRDESAREVSFEPDTVAADVTMLWAVRVLDYDGDFDVDMEWDGYDITVEVNGVQVVNEWAYGEQDYLLAVAPGDQVDVWLWSAWDDYDLELRDDGGERVEHSDLPQAYDPDWMSAEVGGVSSGGRWSGGGGDTAILMCAQEPGEGSPVGPLLPALAVLAALLVVRLTRLPVPCPARQTGRAAAARGIGS